jgi:hypothetical protein
LTREFNAHQNLIKITYYGTEDIIAGTTTYIYTDDDQTFATSTYENIVDQFTGTYTYYKEKLNTISVENMGSGFSGLESKHPVKSSKTELLGLKPDYINYYYLYDNKDRIIIKASYNAKTGKLEDSMAYSYY